jgi:hypothetical protein
LKKCAFVLDRLVTDDLRLNRDGIVTASPLLSSSSGA